MVTLTLTLPLTVTMTVSSFPALFFFKKKNRLSSRSRSRSRRGTRAVAPRSSLPAPRRRYYYYYYYLHYYCITTPDGLRSIQVPSSSLSFRVFCVMSSRVESKSGITESQFTIPITKIRSQFVRVCTTIVYKLAITFLSFFLAPSHCFTSSTAFSVLFSFSRMRDGCFVSRHYIIVILTHSLELRRPEQLHVVYSP